jgi:hypothetical protein
MHACSLKRFAISQSARSDARTRTRRLLSTSLPLQAASVADDASNEAVVIGMRGRTEPLIQTSVQRMFIGPPCGRLGYRNAKAPQARRGDEDEQRTIRRAVGRQVGEPLLDKFFTRP